MAEASEQDVFHCAGEEQRVSRGVCEVCENIQSSPPMPPVLTRRTCVCGRWSWRAWPRMTRAWVAREPDGGAAMVLSERVQVGGVLRIERFDREEWDMGERAWRRPSGAGGRESGRGVEGGADRHDESGRDACAGRGWHEERRHTSWISSSSVPSRFPACLSASALPQYRCCRSYRRGRWRSDGRDA